MYFSPSSSPPPLFSTRGRTKATPPAAISICFRIRLENTSLSRFFSLSLPSWHRTMPATKRQTFKCPPLERRDVAISPRARCATDAASSPAADKESTAPPAKPSLRKRPSNTHSTSHPTPASYSRMAACAASTETRRSASAMSPAAATATARCRRSSSSSSRRVPPPKCSSGNGSTITDILSRFEDVTAMDDDTEESAPSTTKSRPTTPTSVSCPAAEASAIFGVARRISASGENVVAFIGHSIGGSV
mmetsp:Transcript_52858/g.158217  ORF Transcript_52858/g.158217 Transcript_52858/m.158217 type:complete len:248 (-) Transcript_52858:115-858(-)